MNEYGIVHVRTGTIHRDGMSHHTASRFLTEWREDGGKPDAFAIIQRPVGDWEVLIDFGPEVNSEVAVWAHGYL